MKRLARDLAYLVVGLVLGGAMAAMAASGTITRTTDGLQAVYRFTAHGATDTKPPDNMRVISGKWYAATQAQGPGLQSSTTTATDEIQLWGWETTAYTPQDLHLQLVRPNADTVFDLRFRKQNSTQYYKLAFYGGAVDPYKCNGSCTALGGTTVDDALVRVLVTGTGTPRIRVWMGTDTTADIDYTFPAGETWDTGTVSLVAANTSAAPKLTSIAIVTGTSVTVAGVPDTKYAVLCNENNNVAASTQRTGGDGSVTLDVTTLKQPISSSQAVKVEPRLRIHNTSSCAGTADVAESTYEVVWGGDVFSYAASSWLLMGPRIGEVRPTTAKIWVRASESQAYRIQYKLCTDGAYPDDFTTQTVGPTTLVSGANFTATLQFTGLTANTCYSYRTKLGSTIEPNGTGQFTTAPTDGTDGIIKIAFSNCIIGEGRPFTVFNAILAKNPAMFFDLGDTPYADDSNFSWSVNGCVTSADCSYGTDIFRYRYDAILQEPNWNAFMRNYPTLTTWDDHDLGAGDWHGNNTSSLYANASQVFDEYKGSNNPTACVTGGKCFKSTWGNTDFFVLDSRSFQDKLEFADTETLVTTGTVTATNGSTKILCSQADCGWGAGAAEALVTSWEDGGSYTLSGAVRTEEFCTSNGNSASYCASHGNKLIKLIASSDWAIDDIADADYSAKTAVVVDVYVASTSNNLILDFDSTGGTFTNYYTFTFSGLSVGWNRLEATLASASVTGSPAWSSITRVRARASALTTVTYMDRLRVTDSGLWSDTPVLIDGRYYQIEQVDKPSGTPNCSGETNDCAILQTAFQGSTASGKSYTALKREKTRLGWDQLVWLLNGLKDSTARAKIVLSSTAFRFTTNLDTWGHYNSRFVGFQKERNRIFDWCKDQVTNNCAFLSGDSHVGFLAKHTDRDTGGQWEFQASGLSQPSWPSVASINAAGAAAYTNADLLEKNAGRPQFGLVTITTSGSCATSFSVANCIQFQSFDLNGKAGMDSANQRFVTRSVAHINNKRAHQQTQLLKHPLGNHVVTFYDGTNAKICLSDTNGNFAASPPCVSIANADPSSANGPSGVSMAYRDVAATDADSVYTAYSDSAGSIIYATKYTVTGGASPSIAISGSEQQPFVSSAGYTRAQSQITRDTSGYLWVCERVTQTSDTTYKLNIKRSTNVDDITAWGAATDFEVFQATSLIPNCVAGTNGEVLIVSAYISGGNIKSRFYDCTGQACAWTSAVTPITDFAGTAVSSYFPNADSAVFGNNWEFKPVVAHDGNGNFGLLYKANTEPYGCKFKRWDGTNWGATITVQNSEPCVSPSLAYVSGKWFAAYLSPNRQDVKMYRSDASAPASFASHPELQPPGGFTKVKLQFNPVAFGGKIDLSYVRLGSLNDSFDSDGSIVTDSILAPGGAGRVLNQFEFQEEFDKWLDSLKFLVR